MYARPWRNKNQFVITKAEMLVRQKEWNELESLWTGLSTIYLQEKASLDARAVRAIQVEAKVAWTVGPLYNTCGHRECRRVEGTPSEFAMCSRCKQTRFCSNECLAAAWKAGLRL